jgi:STE24 endopeptidase
MVIAPVTIEPLFNSYKPAPPGPTRDAVVALAKRTGVPSDKILIYDGSKQSDRYTANVSGLLGSARVAMSDTMFKQGADLSEVRGVVGHEMGHYARGHAFWGALFMSVLAVVAFFLISRLFDWTAIRAAGTGAISGIADPAGFPVFIILLTLLGLLATPLTNTFSRFGESDADRFSLENAHEPDGLSKALVKTIAYRASSPSQLEEAIFYDHPSVERRVHRAMVWKAEHSDLIGR